MTVRNNRGSELKGDFQIKDVLVNGEDVWIFKAEDVWVFYSEFKQHLFMVSGSQN